MKNINEAAAFWVTGPGRGEIRSEQLAIPKPDEVTVRTLYTGISRGSESLVFRGAVPPSEYQRMRAPFQAGNFPSPVKYGYISVGTVENGPPELTDRNVFCLYPHQTRYHAPADAVYPLPDDVPAERAVLAANLETAINGLWDATPRIGDRVAVVGGGTLGCLIAWLLGQIPGVSAELIDINPDKREAAQALGVGFAVPGQATPEADLVVHCSATQAGLTTALELAAFEARVVEMSWYGDKQVSIPLGEGFHAKRLSICSSQVGTVASGQRERWSVRRRMELALRLLSDPAVEVLITGEDRFESLPLVMERLATTPGNTLCHRIAYC